MSQRKSAVNRESLSRANRTHVRAAASGTRLQHDIHMRGAARSVTLGVCEAVASRVVDRIRERAEAARRGLIHVTGLVAPAPTPAARRCFAAERPLLAWLACCRLHAPDNAENMPSYNRGSDSYADTKAKTRRLYGHDPRVTSERNPVEGSKPRGSGIAGEALPSCIGDAFYTRMRACEGASAGRILRRLAHAPVAAARRLRERRRTVRMLQFAGIFLPFRHAAN